MTSLRCATVYKKVHQIDINVNTTLFDAPVVVHQIDVNVNTTVFDACVVVHQIDANVNTTVFDTRVTMLCIKLA